MRSSIKYALVFLYVMQLSLLFKDTVLHMYKTAVERGQTERDRIARTIGGFTAVLLENGMTPGLDPHETVAGSDRNNLAALLFGTAGDQAHHVNHDLEDEWKRDQKGDKRRAHLKVWRKAYLIADLFSSQRKIPRPLQAEESHHNIPMRLLAFAQCAQA